MLVLSREEQQQMKLQDKNREISRMLEQELDLEKRKQIVDETVRFISILLDVDHTG